MKAILFDFGGVFMKSPFSVLDQVAAEAGLDINELMPIVFGDYGEDGHHPWHQLERGEITLDQAREHILALGLERQLHTDIYELFAQFSDVDKNMNSTLISQLHQWKAQGIKLAIVTNNLKEFDHWRQLFPFAIDDVFDVISDSCYLGFRKPGAEIFQFTLDKLSIQAEDALFVDDFPANVSAAQQMGIRSFCLSSLDDETVNAFIQWANAQLLA